MLYGNQSISTYTRSNIIVWMTMAFQGGVINIGAFMACQHFVSHVTGFATLLGFEVAHQNYSEALGLVIVPVLFLAGAMVSGFLVDLPLKSGKKPKYYFVFGVMFVLILLVVIGGFNGLFGKFGEPFGFTRDYFLLSLLCLICGLQNGTITSVSRTVVRTTHLTGITTDLGVGIVRVLNRSKIIGGTEEDIRANLMRMGLIVSFVLGSVAGGLLFSSGFRGFLLPAFISGALFAVTLYFQVLAVSPVVRNRM